LEEEHIEELYRQLWAIPNLERIKAAQPDHGGGCLVWIRKDLMKEGWIRLEDCHPVSKDQ
jgi:hypothetical protein